MNPTIREIGATAALLCAFTGPLRSQECEPRWTAEFTSAQFNGTSISAVAGFQDGPGAVPALYVGGNFTSIGEQAIGSIARFDGTSWSPLQGGTDGPVNVLAVFDDGSAPALYAGGEFGHAGGIQAGGIARWDGSTWASLGAGVEGSVRALAVFDDGSGPALYVGGDFTIAGGVGASNIAKWDGGSWSALVEGTDGTVEALAVFDDGGGPALYAAGRFEVAGALAVSHIARWDGTAWSGVGGGTSGAVLALHAFDDGTGTALYAGGAFALAGGAAVNHVARWDGRAWSALGPGTSSWVNDLIDYDDGSGPALFAGGRFDEAGSVLSEGIARWDGSDWSALGAGVSGPGIVRAMTVHDDGSAGGPSLIVAGSFERAGDFNARHLARWDGRDWTSFDRDVDGTYVVELLAVERDFDGGPALYVGGLFDSAGGVPAGSIARFDGQTWSSLGEGLNPGAVVTAMAWFDDGSGPALYVAGNLGAVGRWDGRSWSVLDGSVGGYVGDLAVFDDGSGPKLYAGGAVSVDGLGLRHTARWDGAAWSPLGDDTDGTVYALAVYDDGTGPALYAGGPFDVAGGFHAAGIARWNGKQWSAVGGGLDYGQVYSVTDMVVYDDGFGQALYVGGNFTRAGTVEVNNIARWDGREWSSPGGGVLDLLLSLAVLEPGPGARPVLFAGGLLTLAGSMSVNSIARYDGGFWRPLGAGISGGDPVFGPVVYALAGFDDGGGEGPALFAGGNFSTAGGAASQNIARWIDCPIDDPPAYTPCRYHVTVIQGPPDARNEIPPTHAGDMNEAGQVAGSFYAQPGAGSAFIWSAGPGLAILAPPPPFTSAVPVAMNRSADVVGRFDYDSRGFLHSGGQWTVFEPAEGTSEVGVEDINDAGQVVGYRVHPELGAVHAFIWAEGRLTHIVPPGSTSSRALAINNRGQVVGTMAPGIRGFLWEDGAFIDLGFLPGGDQTTPEAIDDLARVVGWGTMQDPDGPGSVHRGFLWSKGRMAELGVASGYRHARAIAINGSGMAVGHSWGGSAPTAAVVWRDGEMQDLNELIPWDLGIRLWSAHAVTGAGEILAEGLGPDGTIAVVLTPVDPPAGDFDGDCEVNDVDLLMLLLEWGKGPSPADLDGDGTVGVSDLMILLRNWLDA